MFFFFFGVSYINILYSHELLFLFRFFFFYEPEILLREKTNYTGKQASPWITETIEGGLLPTSKEPKKLQAKDHFVREWGAILHNLGTQQIKTLGEDVKRIQKEAQMDLILQWEAASKSKRKLE